MQKITYQAVKQALKTHGIGLTFEEIEAEPFFSVFHMHEWQGGYDFFECIEVQTEGVVQKRAAYTGTRRAFYADMFEILDFLLDLLKKQGADHAIIAPFYRQQVFSFGACKNDIYAEILHCLHQNQIKKNGKAGILVHLYSEWDIVAMAVEGAFRDVSELCILIPAADLLIIPNHHFELIFVSEKIENSMNIAQNIINKYPNLRFFKP